MQTLLEILVQMETPSTIRPPRNRFCIYCAGSCGSETFGCVYCQVAEREATCLPSQLPGDRTNPPR